MGTGVSDPVLSSCRVRDVESDILFCFLCFSAQQFKHDGKVLVQFFGYPHRSLGDHRCEVLVGVCFSCPHILFCLCCECKELS